MDRALRYASGAKDFAAAAEKLAPHVKNAAALAWPELAQDPGGGWPERVSRDSL